MGSALSLKRRTALTKSSTILRPYSFDVLSDNFQKNNFDYQQQESKNHSFDDILTFQQNGGISLPSSRGLTSLDSEESFSYNVTNNRFIQKVQSYLRSIEMMGEISKLKFYYGNLLVKTETAEFSVEVKDQESALWEPIITLEPKTNEDNLFLIYTYSIAGKGLNSRYTYLSMLYITNVYQSKCTCHILQAVTNSYGQPSFVPRKIRVPDNPKLISPSSRFITTLKPPSELSTMVLFVNRNLEPFYLSQSDLSLDFSSDDSRAIVLHMKQQYYE